MFCFDEARRSLEQGEPITQGELDCLTEGGIEGAAAAHEPSIRQMRDIVAAIPALWTQDIMQ
jgi:hypothetical protein